MKRLSQRQKGRFVNLKNNICNFRSEDINRFIICNLTGKLCTKPYDADKCTLRGK